MDWRALQDVVTVAETGSLSAAARRLNVSQPTVGRRIMQLEEQLGAILFNRTARGLVLTKVGEGILNHAQQMEEGALAIERIATGANQELQGNVRISLIEDLGIQWIPQKLKEFHKEFPQLAIEVNINNRNVDLSRREADIAIRLARPEQPDLICRKTGMLNFGLYASRSYLDEYGIPEHRRDLKEHFHVGFHEEMLRGANVKRLEALFNQGNIRHRSNSHIEMVEATRAGLGCTALCCFIGDAYPELQRVLFNEIDYAREIWLVTHAEINSSARIRAVFDFLGKALEEDADKLEGISKSS
ncbi:MAG: LysR family transcriptional regulator [Gammaproteobacteria bacterium]|nr:LysR family transcriptional regulator [Gammaproteobacteria bacterium]